MCNFSLIADFDENIVHSRRYGLAQKILDFEVCIADLIAFNKYKIKYELNL